MDRIKFTLTVVLFFSLANIAVAQNTLYLGVLAHQGSERAVAKWYPLTEYLNQKLNGKLITLVPVELRELETMVAKDRLDFVLTNSGHYVQLREAYGLRALASLRNRGNGTSLDSFGSVLFTQNGRKDIIGFHDLKGKRLAAVDRHAFGGFLTVIYEMRQLGMQPFRDINMVFPGFPHDRIAEWVVQGKADAGIVRTGVLESLQQSGKLDLATIRVINPQQTPGFPYLHSTKLYPEWPFAAAKGVPLKLQDTIQQALLQMPKDHPAAVHGNFLGWTRIKDYAAVKPVIDTPIQQSVWQDPLWQWKVWFSHKRMWLIYSLLAGIVIMMLYILRHDISHRYTHRYPH